MNRRFTALAVAAALTLAPISAMAADAQTDLAPGPAAGVQNAQSWYNGNTGLYLAAGAVVVAIIIIAASNGGGNGTSTTTTTGSP
jgi:hypothetical protein